MGDLARFGVSVDAGLLKRFDARNRRKGYANRSEAIRDLVRECLVEEEEWGPSSGTTMGVVSLVFNHHTMDLAKTLTNIQHRRHSLIVTTTHVHLDQHNCLEVLILKGKAPEVRTLAAELISRRGVKHGKLFMTTTGKRLA
jgi:CopG family nickel-responsive transcriptional regulator